MTSASYFSFAPDLPLNTLSLTQPIKGGLRIRLKTTAGVTLDQTTIDRLCFYLAGRDDVANKLLEVCLASGLGVLVRPLGGRQQDVTFLPPSAIRPVGYADDQALLPLSVRSFQGYRLLQEYFSFPQRYRFIELAGLAPSIRKVHGNEVELVVLCGRGDPTLESVVDRSNLQLFCTPAVNLFHKPRVDRIHVNDSTFEFHVVADRTRPLDFEIYQVTNVIGHGAGDDTEQPFLPFYSASSVDVDDQSATRRGASPGSCSRPEGGAPRATSGPSVSVAGGFQAGAASPTCGSCRSSAVHEPRSSCRCRWGSARPTSL